MAPTKRSALRRTAQLLAVGAGERLRPASVVNGRQVPRAPESVTAEWLTAVLCRRAADARVAGVEVLPGSAGTTTRNPLRVTYNDAGSQAGLPTRLFAKCTATIAQRLMLGLGGLIDGEPGFYTAVRPLLEIEAPIGYFGAVDSRSWRSVVLIEDVVGTRGAVFWRPSMTVSREQIEQLLETVASWHGTLWDSHRLLEWRWLKTPEDQMRVIDTLIALADRTAAGARRARAVTAPAVRDRRSDLYEGMRRSMRMLSRGPHTYLHGDLHIANTYLTRDRRMGISDWQVALRGSWAFDFGYLLATALDPRDRRAWERDLLELYLERLAAAGAQTIAFDEAWTAYRRATFYPYFAWIYTIGRSRLQPNFQPPAVGLKMIERISAAIAELESLDAVGL